MVDVMKDATRDLVTKKDLRIELYRAMLLQTGVLTAIVALIILLAQ